MPSLSKCQTLQIITLRTYSALWFTLRQILVQCLRKTFVVIFVRRHISHKLQRTVLSLLNILSRTRQALFLSPVNSNRLHIILSCALSSMIVEHRSKRIRKLDKWLATTTLLRALSQCQPQTKLCLWLTSRALKHTTSLQQLMPLLKICLLRFTCKDAQMQ